MKEAVTKVIDRLTQEDFHGAFQKLLERYNKYITARGDYFEGDYSFTCVLSIKVPTRKSLETYLIFLVYIYIYIYIYICLSLIKNVIQRMELIPVKKHIQGDGKY